MRFAFVGLGGAVRELHLPALARVPQAVVVGGCDQEVGARAAWVRDTGVEAFSTVEELLVRTRPEVVVVATPPQSHADLCIQALRTGAHVLCEKPLATSVEDAHRILATARAADRHVAVNHHFRYQPVFRVVKQRIESGEVGRLVFCQLWQVMNLAPWDEAVAWRAQMSDRALLEAGVHLVDLLVFLHDASPRAVYARHSAGPSGNAGADAIQLVTLEFPGDRLAQLTIDRLSPAATRYCELRADCEGASLRASIGGRGVIQLGKKRAARAGVQLAWAAGGLAWSEVGLQRRVLARNPRRAGVRAVAALIAELVDALKAGREPPSPGREARDVLTVIEAAYRSSETGTRIVLNAGANVR
jgi:predicted dehydrogenase